MRSKNDRPAHFRYPDPTRTFRRVPGPQTDRGERVGAMLAALVIPTCRMSADRIVTRLHHEGERPLRRKPTSELPDRSRRPPKFSTSPSWITSSSAPPPPPTPRDGSHSRRRGTFNAVGFRFQRICYHRWCLTHRRPRASISMSSRTPESFPGQRTLSCPGHEPP